MADKPPVTVTVTGAAGQIGYSLLFRIAAGEMFGDDQPIVLRLLEIEPGMKSLEGVVMEIEDCAFPLVSDIITTIDLNTAFDGTSWALLVGSIPRKAGMERGDLLTVNGGIFGPQGRAIAASAADDVRILVVGNPCNTNCLIARSNAPDVPSDRWFAMTRLDENRAKAQLAAKAGTPVATVSNLAIWGNHSATQFPDYAHALIGESRPPRSSTRRPGSKGIFCPPCRSGAPPSSMPWLSSAASAANAAIDSVVSIRTATPRDDVTSLAVPSQASTGYPKGCSSAFPCGPTVMADGRWSRDSHTTPLPPSGSGSQQRSSRPSGPTSPTCCPRGHQADPPISAAHRRLSRPRRADLVCLSVHAV